MSMLSQASPLPLYRQLERILEERIASGSYPSGHRIPSENELARDFRIGRPTVRQAIQSLCQRGILSRQKGRGTFVREKDEAVDLFSLAGTSRAFLDQGISPVIRIIRKPAAGACKDEGDPDNPFFGKEAISFSRLVSVKKTPVLFEEFFISPQAFPGIEHTDFAKASLAQVIRGRYFAVPEQCRQTFATPPVPVEIAAYLFAGETESRAMLVKRTLSFPGPGDALYSRLWCRTDRFSFSQTIRGAYGQ